MAEQKTMNGHGKKRPPSETTRRTRLRLCLLLLALIVSVLAGWCYFGATRLPAVQPTIGVKPDDRQVNLLALGDWGEDTWAEADVAEAMAGYVEKAPRAVDAVLLAGDNFYEDLTGVDDPRWRLFEDLFDPKRLDMPFYAALGNHDYKGNDLIELEYARLHPESRWKMPARWYRVDLPADHPLVTVFMLDSNYKRMSTEQFEAQRRWLETELRKPRTTVWTVVCAHHPLFTNGKAGDDTFLQEQWGDLFREHHVDFYIAGHDHDMQHLKIPGHATSFMVCGGGGAGIRSLVRSDRGPFAYSMYGFIHLRFGEQIADVLFLDKSGRPVYAFEQRPLSSTEPAIREDAVVTTHGALGASAAHGIVHN
jgi:hypothetical protein